MTTETGGTVTTKEDGKGLPSHFESQAIETKWDEHWESLGIYRFDPSRPREATFVVDTPPPTVSGSLHVGHVFSYTHTDVVVRYKRMRGMNIYYPMGWDDNGLPTERRVQNYYNVRCDLSRTPGPHLSAEEATSTYKKDDPPRIVSRPNFIELCLQLTQEDEKAFKALWRRIGLSVDWKQEYSTIDKHSIKIAQQSFLDLHQKGHVYSVEAPTMWDVDFQTAVAQAELEDKTIGGNFHNIRFGVQASDETFVIATTRPELLPACVGVAAHPDDERFKHLFGKNAITPLFNVPVPIFATELADPEKGTGILMVCTFGDATDVAWWKEQKLELRQILGRDGRLVPIQFGTKGWQSENAERANALYAEITGKNVKQAQKIIVEMLRKPENAAIGSGSEAALVGEPKPIEHSVKFFEKGDRPLEFITTRQWFVRLMDKKEQLVKKGDEITWHPDHMRLRYKNWTENLLFDWCVSRQRYFGVPFPVWYPIDASGIIQYDQPILADMRSLPIDPTIDVPAGYEEKQRDQPNGFKGEADVFDTWFTSSMTPQLCSHWLIDEKRHHQLFPMDLRPQSHEIIRTWAFYTIAKAMLHEDKVPWKQVAISGWVLDPDRKKMSKSKGNVLTPMHLLDQYGADGVRYWSASARLGTDTAFDENVLKIGKRLVTKIFNAGKFVYGLAGEEHSITRELDLGFLQRLKRTVAKANQHFENFDYGLALSEAEKFFWNDFTDEYIEMAKQRAYNADDPQGRGSALSTLRFAMSTILRLFAPFLPYVTEEVWSWSFAEKSGQKSIHKASFPQEKDFEAFAAPADEMSFQAAANCRGKVNQQKTDSSKSVGSAMKSVVISCSEKSFSRLTLLMEDFKAAIRAAEIVHTVDNSLGDCEFAVKEAQFE
ncbi:MAG: valine--tRNA ligase [Candidatus Obscuribacterales bacterium]|nr:valine--tRNA ligase [Candidatus Obscuribacterales bacterium]